MTDKPKDQEKDEDAKRRDEVLERMLKTPHKPHSTRHTNNVIAYGYYEFDGDKIVSVHHELIAKDDPRFSQN